MVMVSLLPMSTTETLFPRLTVFSVPFMLQFTPLAFDPTIVLPVPDTRTLLDPLSKNTASEEPSKVNDAPFNTSKIALSAVKDWSPETTLNEGILYSLFFLLILYLTEKSSVMVRRGLTQKGLGASARRAKSRRNRFAQPL
jgi:hypothetical protein